MNTGIVRLEDELLAAKNNLDEAWIRFRNAKREVDALDSASRHDWHVGSFDPGSPEAELEQAESEVNEAESAVNRLQFELDATKPKEESRNG